MDITDIFPQDPLEASIKYAGIVQCPITVPWAQGRVTLCVGFNSQRASNDTLFMPSSAFRDVHTVPLRYRECQTTSIQDESSSDVAFKSETSTFAISASVGGSFLGASGRGSYEKNVRDNTNTSNISIRAEHVCGQIEVEFVPDFQQSAVRLLQTSADPINEFRQKYGDFYVAGYRVGAINNTTIYGELANKSFFEAKRAELKVKVLFASIHKSINEVSQSGSDVGGLGVTAFDSLTAFYANFTARTIEESLRAGAIATENKQKAMNISKRATEILHKDFSLSREGIVYQEVVNRLCDQGLVTELLLSPFASLRQYQALLARRHDLKRQY